MADREKVIRGLEQCIHCMEPKECEGCPYEGERTYAVPCGHVLMADALAMLKEQEVTPSYNDAVDTIKFQSKVLGLACETLAGYESEEP